jgi:hypothetical protein
MVELLPALTRYAIMRLTCGGSLLKQATLRLQRSNQGGLKRNFIPSIAT